MGTIFHFPKIRLKTREKNLPALIIENNNKQKQHTQEKINRNLLKDLKKTFFLIFQLLHL